MEKQISHAFGKDVYLLGKDEKDINYWLAAAQWDCDWYWGFGYVGTYYNNAPPSKAKDTRSHKWIKGSFLGRIEGAEYVHNIFDSKKIVEKTFTSEEGWTLSELLMTAYDLQAAAQLYHIGGSGVATNPLKNLLISPGEWKRINQVLLPAIFSEIHKILSPKS